MSSPQHAPKSPSNASRFSVLAVIGPGILVAATGVGAGDLATGAFSGASLGVAVLWAVLFGATMKFVLNEGLARWQLVTGDTLLEGVARHFGPLALGAFLLYMLLWSFWVSSALMSACGVAAHALLPINPENADADKIIYGMLHSIAAIALVVLGGYRLFQRVMSVCIGLMFATVVVTAVSLQPDWGDVLRGMFVPGIPDPRGDGQGLGWTVALIGGVGGTLTVLCYGYWIAEEGRQGVQALRACRLDLATGYTMTAVFGLAMVILGTRLEVTEGLKSASLLVDLGVQLEEELGAFFKWLFLVGAWGAVASSLLGVWQSVPYMFADIWRLLQRRYDDDRIDTRGIPYLTFLLVMGTLPAVGLWSQFSGVQKLNAIIGAAFMPLLALTLLILNGQRRLVGELRNSALVTLCLLATLAFFIWSAIWG